MLISYRAHSHDTIRPVKRLDSAGSHRASTEFVGSLRQRQDSGSSSGGSHRSKSSAGSSDLASTAGTTPNPSNASSAGGADSGQEAQLGRALVDEVVGPAIERLTSAGDRKGKGKGVERPMDARDIEALSMIRKGFEDLAESNPTLAWQAMADLLGGINECVLYLCSFHVKDADPDALSAGTRRSSTRSPTRRSS